MIENYYLQMCKFNRIISLRGWDILYNLAYGNYLFPILECLGYVYDTFHLKKNILSQGYFSMCGLKPPKEC